MSESIGSEDSHFSLIDDRSVLATALEQLAPRERAILGLRFGEGLTQSEIAARMGVSQMQISRILAASIDRLRASLSEDRQPLDA